MLWWHTERWWELPCVSWSLTLLRVRALQGLKLPASPLSAGLPGWHLIPWLYVLVCVQMTHRLTSPGSPFPELQIGISITTWTSTMHLNLNVQNRTSDPLKVGSSLTQPSLSWQMAPPFTQWSRSQIYGTFDPTFLHCLSVSNSSARLSAFPPGQEEIVFSLQWPPLARLPQSLTWSIAVALWHPAPLLPLYNTFSAE